ncbi:MAG TPA: hypothetical protein VF905_04905 [Nitrospirota bacterium]
MNVRPLGYEGKRPLRTDCARASCWKEIHRQCGIHDFLGERVVASFEFFAQKLGIVSRPLAEEVFAALIRELVVVKTPSSNMRISLT